MYTIRFMNKDMCRTFMEFAQKSKTNIFGKDYTIVYFNSLLDQRYLPEDKENVLVVRNLPKQFTKIVLKRFIEITFKENHLGGSARYIDGPYLYKGFSSSIITLSTREQLLTLYNSLRMLEGVKVNIHTKCKRLIEFYRDISDNICTVKGLSINEEFCRSVGLNPSFLEEIKRH